MRFSRKHLELLGYGLSMAVLLVLLQWLQVKFVVFSYRLDMLIGSIAILFTVLGIWLARSLSQPTIETVIIEKEVAVTPTTEVNRAEIERLGISKRELAVLELMAQGLSNEEIAEKLFVSLNTVKTHSSNIFMKLEVNRRMQAAEKAKRLRIIT